MKIEEENVLSIISTILSARYSAQITVKEADNEITDGVISGTGKRRQDNPRQQSFRDAEQRVENGEHHQPVTGRSR